MDWLPQTCTAEPLDYWDYCVFTALLLFSSDLKTLICKALWCSGELDQDVRSGLPARGRPRVGISRIRTFLLEPIGALG